MKRPIKKLLCSLIGVSLIISAAGCHGRQTGTARSESVTTTKSGTSETTAVTEVTAEEVKSTEGTSMKADGQKFQYRPGDVITFGKFEQDNKESNGKEDIEWIILAREGSKALVISRCALACKPYNTKKTDVTWETCSLRKWLNKDFYESAFDEEDKGYIIKTDVPADKNPEYETSQGKPTKDNVFLLSIAEFNKYFPSEKNVMCDGTPSCQAQDKTRNCTTFVWWLRTTGYSKRHAACVLYYADGPVTNYGVFVNRVSGCTSMEELGNSGVRPAMWIELPDHYNSQNKKLNAWVEGYATAHINYDSAEEVVWVDIPNVPCYILYTDGFPSSSGEVRPRGGTDKTIEEWLHNNVGNVGYGWAGDSLLVAGSGHLEKDR